MPHRGNLAGMEKFLMGFPDVERQRIMEMEVIYGEAAVTVKELALFMKLGLKPHLGIIMMYLMGDYYHHLDAMVAGGWKPRGGLITEVSRFYDREIKKKPHRTERYERRRLRKVGWLVQNCK